MIPKVIHYCWFGGNPKPEIVVRCIQSWEKYMPDCKIVEWNENNYDIYKSDYAKQAFEMKMWAFVSDYARFDILERFGGIYFDTDVELLKPIPDYFLHRKAFTCMEPSGKVNPGLIFASEAGTPFLHDIVEIYNQARFQDESGQPICKTVNLFTTEKLVQSGYQEIDVYQEIGGLTIYPSEFFCSFDLDVMEPNITDKSISVHHYSGTWTKKGLKRKIQSVFKSLLGIERYRKFLDFVRRIR